MLTNKFEIFKITIKIIIKLVINYKKFKLSYN